MGQLESNSAKEIHEIWNAVTAYPLSDSDSALRRLLEGLLEMLSASRVLWIAAARNKNRNSIPTAELLDDWYVLDTIDVSIPCSEVDTMKRKARYYQLAQQYGIDEGTAACIAKAGENRVQLRSDVLTDEQWRKHWLMTEFEEDLDYSDVMQVVTNVDEDCESYIVVYRKPDKPSFGEQEALLASTAVFGMHALHRRLMTMRGAALPSTYLLSPQEKIVLNLFVAGAREKEIANHLEVSESTVRKHVSAIYRKFNVNGKFELLTAVYA